MSYGSRPEQRGKHDWEQSSPWWLHMAAFDFDWLDRQAGFLTYIEQVLSAPVMAWCFVQDDNFTGSQSGWHQSSYRYGLERLYLTCLPTLPDFNPIETA